MKMRFVSRLLICFGLMAVLASPAKSQTPQENFVSGLSQRVIDILEHRNEMGPDKIKAQFATMLHQNFDVPAIGRFTLGQYWRSSTPSQQQDYLRSFEGMIVNVYTERFNQYDGQTFKITGSQPDGQDMIVKSLLTQPEGQSAEIDWRVRGSAPGNFKITDVIVENVSMSITQRADFAAVIEKNGGNIDALINDLHQRASQ